VIVVEAVGDMSHAILLELMCLIYQVARNPAWQLNTATRGPGYVTRGRVCNVPGASLSDQPDRALSQARQVSGRSKRTRCSVWVTS
jgi:hypothetical protein